MVFVSHLFCKFAQSFRRCSQSRSRLRCKITEYSLFSQGKYGIFRIKKLLKNVTSLIMTDLELKELRKKLGLTQADMASLVGVDIKTIQNWERGRKIPKSKDGILRNLETNPHIVFGGQHVQNGDAVNGDKIVEQIRDEVIDEKFSIQNMECSFEQLINTISRMQTTIDKLVAQQDRYLTIIENLQIK